MRQKLTACLCFLPYGPTYDFHLKTRKLRDARIIIMQSAALRNNNGRGGALVEFAIILPVVMLLVTATFNLGRFLWQIQMVSDAARYGVRAASAMSDIEPSKTCTQLRSEATAQAATYRYPNEGLGVKKRLGDLWDVPTASVGTKYTFKGIPMRVIKVEFRAADMSENCVFCYGAFLKKIIPSATASLDLGMKSACMNE